MNATAWIAIAAIIITSINSWGQFWLKQRSETKKALADASPAANQPKATSQLPTLGFWVSVRRGWFRILLQWAMNFTGVFLLILQYRSTAPLTRPSVVLIALTASGWAYLSILFFILDERFPAK